MPPMWPTHRVKAAQRTARHRWMLKRNRRDRRTPLKNKPAEPAPLN